MHIITQGREVVNESVRKSAKWIQKRKQAIYMSHRLQAVPSLEKRAGRMAWCSTLRHSFICPDCGKVHYKSGGYCRDRLCPMCQWRMSMTKYRQMMEVLSALSERFKNQEIFASMLTLTCRNVPVEELKGTLVTFGRAWQAVSRRVCLTQSHVIGWARNTEITRNPRAKNYHPHIHVFLLWEADETLDINSEVKAIRQEWERQIQADYPTIWHHEIAFSKSGTAKYITDYQSDAEAAAAEASMYALSSSVLLQIPEDELSSFAYAINNVKMTGYGGIIKQVRAQLDLKEEAIDDHICTEKPICPGCGAEMLHLVERWNNGEDNNVAPSIAGTSNDVYNAQFMPNINGCYEVIEVIEP